MAAAVGPFPKMAGLASALLGFIQLATGAVFGQILMRFHDGTTRPLAGGRRAVRLRRARRVPPAGARTAVRSRPMVDFSEITSSPLFIVGAAFGLIGLLQMAAGFIVLFRRQPVGFLVRLLIGMAVAAAGVAAAAVAVGIRGYEAFTRETVAARISVVPSGPQRFDARVKFADGREAGFVIAGDELYVDAHILKWKAIANVLGLHTAYELDRIAGRYRAVEQERKSIRTVYPLGGAEGGRPLRPAREVRLARAAPRRRVRVGELRAGDEAGGAGGAGVDDRPPDPRGREERVAAPGQRFAM